MFRSNPVQPSESIRPQASLGRRLALVLLPLVLIPVALMGAGAYIRSRDLLREQANAQLVAATQSQVTSLLEWADTRLLRLQLGSQRGQLRDPLAELIHHEPTGDTRDEYLQAARSELESLRTSEGQVLFSHIMAVEPSSGRIVAATNQQWEGQNLSTELMAKGLIDHEKTFPIYDDPLLGASTLTLVSLTPMRTGMMQEFDAVLVGVNQETRVGALMEELQIFSQQRGVFRERTGETFLAIAPDIIAQLPRYSTGPQAILGTNHPIFGLHADQTAGTAEYENLEGVPVLGAYEWIPDWEMGVLIEVPQEVVFSGLNSLLPFTVTLIVAAGVTTVVVVLLATSRMLRPLGQLAEFAQRFARGDWSARVPETRKDEIGTVSAALNTMAEELSQSYATLEMRVEARTRQIRTAAEVARAVTSIPTLEDLLRQAVELIRDRFGHSYAAIFLIDRQGQYAELRAATGEVGQALKARSHKLAVGSNSIIGWVTVNNRPRVASDVADDPMHYENELLPDTRSEAAVPLQVGGVVLGALDVQSNERNAFTPEDIEVLQTLADQLSAAIQNARLAETSAAAAERARLISEVTGQLSGLLDVDQVLNTAALSLHRALGQPEIMIKLTVGEATDGQPFDLGQM